MIIPTSQPEVKSTGAAFRRGKSYQSYETPWVLIRAVEDRFGPLSVDLAATSQNKKAPICISEEDDAFFQNWSELYREHGDQLLWLNPPFNHITPWARRCSIEAKRGARIALLVPASIGSKWYWDYVHDCALTLCLTPRVSFDNRHVYPKDLILAVYNSGHDGKIERWQWQKGL